ncbi:MAG: 2-oxoglutarate and iron-dependent oxygenase domain-containing protein [Waddliaceae bacterium]
MSSPHHPSSTPIPSKKNSFRKGLGFFPNTMGRSIKEPIKEMLRTAPQITKGIYASTGKNASFGDSGSTIPLFDLDHLSNASGNEKSRLIQAFGIGLTQVGFVAVKAENLIPLIDQVHKEMKRYFHQPFEQKILDWRTNETMLGYSPRSREKTSHTRNADIKETFFIPPNFRDWPRGHTSFMRVMSQYHSILTECARHLTMYIMTYLGQHKEEVEKTHDSAQNILRLIYYPSIKPDDDPKAIWTAPHCDQSLLTLSSPGTIPGLQLLSNHNQWQPVIVPEEFFVLNTGLQLQHKTAGLIKARLHRVTNPGGPYTRLERFGTAYSISWSDDYSLAPFENCIELVTRGMSEKKKQAHLEEYTTITVAEKAKTDVVFSPS